MWGQTKMGSEDKDNGLLPMSIYKRFKTNLKKKNEIMMEFEW